MEPHPGVFVSNTSTDDWQPDPAVPGSDEREISAEHRSCRGREIERAVFDQAHHRERRQTFRLTRDRELRIDRVGYLVAAVGPYSTVSAIGTAASA